ncbi:MAG: nucleotide exchange factor GrpE [Chloroflexi bacterium]|nr:nucleotide exchange factor GrpE [Chloroflexota bacterium]
MNKEEEREPGASGQSPEDTPEDTPGETGDEVPEETATVDGDEIAPDSELAEALREKDQFRVLAQRTQADFVNFRSRIETENAEIRRRSVRSVLIQILEVADSIDAALESEVITGVDQKFVDGVEAIGRSFESFLSGESVEKFDSVGEKFDPRLHEALMRTEIDDYPPDTVIRVMRAGYKMGDDVLRPALVEVAAPPASQASEDGDAADAEPE